MITPFNARLSSRLVPTVRGVYADDDIVVVLFDGEGIARDMASPTRIRTPGICVCETG